MGYKLAVGEGRVGRIGRIGDSPITSPSIANMCDRCGLGLRRDPLKPIAREPSDNRPETPTQSAMRTVKMNRLSCRKFRSNEVRLWRTILAYNLGNLWWRLLLPQRIEKWSLTSLQQGLVKTGGRLVKHARYYWLLLAEGTWSFSAKSVRSKVQPRLAKFPMSAISSALGVSCPYATDMRSGKRQPHPRQWSKLAELVGIIERESFNSSSPGGNETDVAHLNRPSPKIARNFRNFTHS